MSTTNNEARFLQAIASSEFRTSDDLTEPVWMDCIEGWEPSAKGGTVASLSKKGLVGFDDYSDPGNETVWLTDEGIAALAASKASE